MTIKGAWHVTVTRRDGSVMQWDRLWSLAFRRSIIVNRRREHSQIGTLLRSKSEAVGPSHGPQRNHACLRVRTQEPLSNRFLAPGTGVIARLQRSTATGLMMTSFAAHDLRGARCSKSGPDTLMQDRSPPAR